MHVVAFAARKPAPQSVRTEPQPRSMFRPKRATSATAGSDQSTSESGVPRAGSAAGQCVDGVQGLHVLRDAPVDAQHSPTRRTLEIDHRREGQRLEDLTKAGEDSFPVFLIALLLETVCFAHYLGFVVASEEINAVRPVNLQQQQSEHQFGPAVAMVHIVSEEDEFLFQREIFR